MTDHNTFDELDKHISDKLSHLPLSEETFLQTTPWKGAINQIIIGFALTNFLLNFLHMQYILPWIGTLLMYLGFRTLRQDNKWFCTSYIISGIKVIYTLYLCIFITTQLSQIEWLSTINNVMASILDLSLLIAFRAALRYAFVQVNEKPTGDPLLLAIIFKVTVIIMSLSPLSISGFAFISVIILYILIIILLTKAGKNLDQWGYQVHAATVHMSKNMLSILYLILIIAIIGTGSVISSRISMKAYEISLSADSDQQPTRDYLVKLGFPKVILTDISDEELHGMENALQCEVHSNDMNLMGKGTAMTSTTVYTELPGGKLRTVIYFDWIIEPRIFWQEAIQITGGKEQSEASGKILYDKNRISCAAPITKLTTGIGAMKGPMFNNNSSFKQILAKFSYPSLSSKQRGYVIYTISFDESKRYAISTILNYYHQTNPIVLPYMDVCDNDFSKFGRISPNFAQSYTVCDTIFSS